MQFTGAFEKLGRRPPKEGSVHKDACAQSEEGLRSEFGPGQGVLSFTRGSERGASLRGKRTISRTAKIECTKSAPEETGGCMEQTIKDSGTENQIRGRGSPFRQKLTTQNGFKRVDQRQKTGDGAEKKFRELPICPRQKSNDAANS